MKYDDASWHFGGELPEGLPMEAGATHTGMFVAWALLNGLGGEIHTEEFPDDLAKLAARKISPGAFFLSACDGKFTDEDLSEEGNQFAQSYFDIQDGQYIHDYRETVVQDLPSDYHVPDTWNTYDALDPIIRKRFKAWRFS